MDFKDFNLHPDLQKGIDKAGYISCMPVQEQVLSNAFGVSGGIGAVKAACNDLYVQSQTGTGKTAAFLIVIFQRMLAEDVLFKRKALIMAPTRELAVQIEEEAKRLGKYLPFKIGSFYGGVGYEHQEKLLKDNVQILVGTPGRVLDLNKSGKMNLMDIAFLILDEADRMFDMGFYPDLRKLIKVVPSVDRRQTMLFSATLNAWVKNLAWEYTKTPFEIEIKPEIVTVEEITQILYHVPKEEKIQLLLGILKSEQPDSAIIFCNTKKHTEIVAKRLQINNIPCEFIIGDLPQVKRLKIINNLKAGKIKTLVATDVAARGLDIEALSMVINYDVPTEAENYVHRIGRTARAGKTGKAVTLASEQDVYELPDIENYIGKKIPSVFAREEMYAEDKSANQFIETEYCEDRSQSSRRESGFTGGKKRSAVRGTADSGAISGGNTKRKDNRRKTGGGTRSSIETRRTVGSQQSGNAGQNRGQHGQDLSQLTMEERMALYKKKYAANSASPSSENLESKIEIEQKQNRQPQENVVAKKNLFSKFIGLFKRK